MPLTLPYLETLRSSWGSVILGSIPSSHTCLLAVPLPNPTCIDRVNIFKEPNTTSNRQKYRTLVTYSNLMAWIDQSNVVMAYLSASLSSANLKDQPTINTPTKLYTHILLSQQNWKFHSNENSNPSIQRASTKTYAFLFVLPNLKAFVQKIQYISNN